MKFWQSFSKKEVLKQLFFVLFVFVLLIPIVIWDSNTQVKVTFDASEMYVKSDKYTMTVAYDLIASAELTDLAEAGEKLESGFDNDIIRTGVWKNDTWGEYYICVDLDASNCIAIHLNDGRLFIISSKNNEKTAEIHETLQGYLTVPEA